MLMLKLKELHIKNFKSLRDCKLKLRNFNVLVGANATGKTNLVDLFMLLRKIYVEKDINPFRYWWGYQNAVWDRKEELDISVKFLFDYINGNKTYKVSFETTFTGRGGKFEIVREKLEINSDFSLELIPGRIRSEYKGDYAKLIPKIMEDFLKEERENLIVSELREDKIVIDHIITPSQSLTLLNLSLTATMTLYHYKNINIALCYLIFPSQSSVAILSPLVKPAEFYNEKFQFPLAPLIIKEISNLISKTLILKLNINEIKRPSPLKREDWLIEDGSNLNSVLYNLYLKGNRIPDRIATLILYLFPNINLGFSVTEDQRVYLKVQEDSLELPPACIADGLYKLLAILTALELKPSLLIIDEVENSLHPETLEKLLDELKSSETTVIITTHSPIVVDMTDPADLVIVEKVAGETKFRRIENPEEVKKKLKEAGITFSEGWLYGQI